MMPERWESPVVTAQAASIPATHSACMLAGRGSRAYPPNPSPRAIVFEMEHLLARIAAPPPGAA
eukprot:3936505-Rhodomonas_salina.1